MRLVVLCGKTVVDLDRVVAVVGNVVTFMPNMEKISIPQDAAGELLGMLKREQEGRTVAHGQDADGAKDDRGRDARAPTEDGAA